MEVAADVKLYEMQTRGDLRTVLCFLTISTPRHSSQITIMIIISISVSTVSTSCFVDYYKELQRQEVLADMRAKVCCMFLSLTFSLSQHLAT